MNDADKKRLATKIAQQWVREIYYDDIRNMGLTFGHSRDDIDDILDLLERAEINVRWAK